jgi:hypothetical protein
MSALKVNEGAIKIDGRLDDWPSAKGNPAYQLNAAGPAYMNKDFTRGPWEGEDDLSITVRAAHDSANLYVGGTVRDQLLFNEGTADDPWVGDDVEIYIDANPIDQQFRDGVNENCVQFIFIPEHINQNGHGVFVWHSDKFPGVIAASRLTPLGYSFELRIPTAVIPNWKANPNLPSIGFDVQVDDADTAGLLGHDAGPKEVMFLLQPFQHFLSAAKLGSLLLDTQTTRAKTKREKAGNSLPGYKQAQFLLDHFDDAHIDIKVNAALARPDLARKAALYILMRRPDLPADSNQIASILREPVSLAALSQLTDARIYAMIALAERHRLPAAETLAAFGESDNLLLRYTALRSIGLNGDKSVVPTLVKLFAAIQHPATHELIAMTLAQLGDATSASVLKAVALRDRGQVTGNQCLKLLQDLGIS